MLRLFAWAANVTVEIVVPVYIAIWLFKQGTTSAYFLAVVWIFICICAGLDWLLRAKEIENREKHKQWFREPGTILGVEVKDGEKYDEHQNQRANQVHRGRGSCR